MVLALTLQAGPETLACLLHSEQRLALGAESLPLLLWSICTAGR